MDYLKDYKSIIKKESTILKEFIVETLKNEKNNGRPFEKALTNLQNLFYEKFTNQSSLKNHLSYFEPMCNDLVHHATYYDSSNCDSMLKTLEIEIYEKYLSVIETFKTHNIDPDFSENMKYEKFYPEILKYFLYKRVYNRLDKSIFHLTEAFKLFYEIDDYGDLRTSYLIDEEKKVTELKIHNIFLKNGRKYISLKLKEIKNNSIKSISKPNDIEEIISTLTEQEKLILIHLCLKEKNSIPKTEKAKLILLSQGITNYSIFYEMTNMNSLYKRINEGFDYRSSKENNISLINSILSKIESIKLIKTNKVLTNKKTELLKSN